MTAPVLLITFNRPEHTRKVLSAILSSEVKELYVFQDGMREDNVADKEKCQKVCEVIQELTTSANVNLHTFYSDKNLGCGPGPAAAISWFFENVEQGIILEDDCLPHPDFFPYCEELLEKYKEDNSVFCISGDNWQSRQIGNGSYYLVSGHHSTCGWAGWRRSFESFDYNLESLSEKEFRKIIKYYTCDLKQKQYWLEIFRMVKKNQMNNSCWDYQFYFGNWKHKRCAIAPNTNLISNIGNDLDATHSSGSVAMMNVAVGAVMPLTHTSLSYNKKVDDYHMRQLVIPYEYGWSGLKRLPYRINKSLKRLLNHDGPWVKEAK